MGPRQAPALGNGDTVEALWLILSGQTQQESTLPKACFACLLRLTNRGEAMVETQDSAYGFSYISILVKGKDLKLSEWNKEFDKASSPISDVADIDVLLQRYTHLHFIKEVI